MCVNQNRAASIMVVIANKLVGEVRLKGWVMMGDIDMVTVNDWHGLLSICSQKFEWFSSSLVFCSLC